MAHATPARGGGPVDDGVTFAGHPPSLFMLFFAEMWERFSYYGMRALLVFYMMKGFLGYGDKEAYAVYGAYTALVYMTPFFGGLLADRLLGPKRAVVLGGLLMAAGHAVMGVHPDMLSGFGIEVPTGVATGAFFTALALLIIGNGFFKPNISTIVGAQYRDHDPRRDGGFTIFYMGINLGAAMSPLLCGYIGETYGWHYGFNLATAGMLLGLAVFVVPTLIARFLIGGGAIATSIAMVALQDNLLLMLVNGAVALALAVAGVIAFLAMSRGGLPEGAGGAPDEARLRRKVGGVISLEWAVYAGSFVVVPFVATLVWANSQVKLIPDETLESLTHSTNGAMVMLGTLLSEFSRPAGLLLGLCFLAFVYIFVEAIRAPRVERDRLLVVITMFVFSALFWAFFEQAGSSVNNFTDRNVDRVFESSFVTETDVGTVMPLTLTQAQLGYPQGGELFTLDKLDAAREAQALQVEWQIEAEHVGMGLASSEVPASTFQSANPIYILLFGLVFSALWNFLARRNLEPGTPVKFSLGLLQLGLGFAALWYGAQTHDDRGMVWLGWLLLGYLLHTTGELCLSPIGLSMVTKLSPTRLVSTVMGGWFLATAYSSYLAAIIASFTGVGHGAGEEASIPAPIETVAIYGGVFGQIAIAATISAAVLLVLSPWLKKGMHEDLDHDLDTKGAHG